MKPSVVKVQRYLKYYQAVLGYHFKGLLSYRLDFLLRLLFVTCYFFISIASLKIIFSKVDSILGWTQEEAFLFMSVYQLTWSLGYIFFFGGFRNFSWDLVRTGNFDFMLLRPLSSRFQISFSKPSFNDFGAFVFALILFFWSAKQLNLVFGLANIFFFLLAFALGEMVYYFLGFMITILGLYTSQSGHILEFFDKTMEFSQYPTDVFKGKFYFLFYSFVPVALISFLPCRFLLGKAPLWLIIIPIAVSILLYFASRLLFSAGLKHYSSASS